MKILHFSDNHGNLNSNFFKGIEDVDVVVCSGDFFPNRTRGIRKVEAQFQHEWLRRKMLRMQKIFGDKPFLFCAGNHDYFSPEKAMQSAGIQAYDITYRRAEIDGCTFFGTPYVPYLAGEWNYELDPETLEYWTERIPHCDVLVSHCPPYMVGDWTGCEHIGNKTLSNTIGMIEPKAVLCGHCHESPGLYELFGKIPVSNAAGTSGIVEI